MPIRDSKLKSQISHLKSNQTLNIQNTTTYYSHGKLLLTGEYLVLDGALALAVPTQKGQSLSITPIAEPKISWKSFDNEGNLWFERNFHLPVTPRKSDSKTVQTLKQIFLSAQTQNPLFLSENGGFKVETNLEFPRDWGLGSSSTLLHNIAIWTEVNPYILLQETMGGSGYDIACAGSKSPILYRLENTQPVIQPVKFKPPFAEQLYFVHLNHKQRSRKEVSRYKNIQTDKKEVIPLVNQITELMLKVKHLNDFETLITEHEKIMANVLHRNPVQTHFRDYFGKLKSLGAWGGDFMLATGNEDTPEYFRKKGFETVIPYIEMVLPF